MVSLGISKLKLDFRPVTFDVEFKIDEKAILILIKKSAHLLEDLGDSIILSKLKQMIYQLLRSSHTELDTFFH